MSNTEFNEARDARLQREAEIEEANRLRTAAGETPNPTQDPTDTVQAYDAQTGAQFQIPATSGGGGGPILVAEIDWTGTHTTSEFAVYHYQPPTGADWVVRNANYGFGYDDWNSQYGIAIADNGVLELSVLFRGIDDEAVGGINMTSATVRVALDSPNGYPIPHVAPLVNTGTSAYASVRWVVQTDEALWHLDDDPTNTRNICLSWMLHIPNRDTSISITGLRVQLLWTPAG